MISTEGGSSPPTCNPGGRKLEIPIFSRHDSYRWTVPMERYFKLNMVREEKLDVVVLVLESWALTGRQKVELANHND